MSGSLDYSESDIYGYLHGEAVYCPACIAQVFTEEARAFEPPQPAEIVLSRVAAHKGIDRGNERSFPSYRFPKPLHINEISDADRCNFCGLRLAPGPR